MASERRKRRKPLTEDYERFSGVMQRAHVPQGAWEQWYWRWKANPELVIAALAVSLAAEA